MTVLLSALLFCCSSTFAVALRRDTVVAPLAPVEETIFVTDCNGAEYALPLAGSDSAVAEQMRANAVIAADASGMATAINFFVEAKIAKLQGILTKLRSSDQAFINKLRSFTKLNICDDPNDPDIVNSENISNLFGENPPVFSNGVLEDESSIPFLQSKKVRRKQNRLFHSDQANLAVKDILPNDASGLHLFQGDMLYAKSMVENRATTSTASDTVYWNAWALWPGAQVNWYVDAAAPVDACANATFVTAASLMEKYTCLRFVEGKTPGQSVKLTSDGTSCWAYVGMSASSQVNLGGSGCQVPGIALHELGHAVGLIHQQSREDRDTYVTIGWKNVKDSAKNNFMKIMSNSDFDRVVSQQAYDYTSVMHYSACEFSTTRFDSPCGETIEPASPSFLDEMGQRDHLSPLDIQTINSMYGCTATCGDGIQNQGEEGVDCGGPCRRICNDPTSDGIVPLPSSCEVENDRSLTTTEIILISVVIGLVILAVLAVMVARTVAKNRRKEAAKARLRGESADLLRTVLNESAAND